MDARPSETELTAEKVRELELGLKAVSTPEGQSSTGFSGSTSADKVYNGLLVEDDEASVEPSLDGRTEVSSLSPRSEATWVPCRANSHRWYWWQYDSGDVCLK
ncbi:unnamed protein product, partial [Effrenium voratum]